MLPFAVGYLDGVIRDLDQWIGELQILVGTVLLQKTILLRSAKIFRFSNTKKQINFRGSLVTILLNKNYQQSTCLCCRNNNDDNTNINNKNIKERQKKLLRKLM